MNLAHFRFYEELNDFLPPGKKKKEFLFRFDERQSVKDVIESLGVPHTEVDLIIVNGDSVDFSYRPKDEDKISVYPVFESFDITGLTLLRPKPLRELRFILDVHLGRLAKYLRLCGFDTSFSNYFDDREIIDISVSEKRIILTRDKQLLKNSRVTHGYWIRSQNHEEQLKEVFERFALKNNVELFTRCLKCNCFVEEVRKEDIINRLQANTSRYFSEFKKCPVCNRIYWNGSHYQNMTKKISDLCGTI